MTLKTIFNLAIFLCVPFFISAKSDAFSKQPTARIISLLSQKLEAVLINNDTSHIITASLHDPNHPDYNETYTIEPGVTHWQGLIGNTNNSKELILFLSSPKSKKCICLLAFVQDENASTSMTLADLEKHSITFVASTLFQEAK